MASISSDPNPDPELLELLRVGLREAKEIILELLTAGETVDPVIARRAMKWMDRHHRHFGNPSAVID